MKQFFASILISLFVASGLVAAGGATAQAAECPYTGCIATRTTTKVPATIKQGTPVAAVVKVATNGNAKPKGTIKLEVKRVQGGYFWSKTFSYTGGTKILRGPRLSKLGKYFVTAKYVPAARAPYKRSSDAAITTVVKRRG